MGQYYAPVSLDKKQWIYSHTYQNGLKIMEHSYVGNDFVGAVERLLIPGGDWYKTRIIWAGDYADEEVSGEFYKLDESGKPRTINSLAHQWDEVAPKPLTWAEREKYPYLLNHSKKQYVNMQNLDGKDNTLEAFDQEDTYLIDPLPLLTAEGNGRGGGDFHGEDSRIGTWARDTISLEEKVPEGYEQINGLFIE